MDMFSGMFCERPLNLCQHKIGMKIEIAFLLGAVLFIAVFLAKIYNVAAMISIGTGLFNVALLLVAVIIVLIIATH